MNDWDPFAERLEVSSVRIADTDVKAGDHVVLRPLGRADILDLALEGMEATVESIEQDFENRIYLAVVVGDDPGQDLGRMRQPGHRFFFGIDEVEPLLKEMTHDES